VLSLSLHTRLSNKQPQIKKINYIVLIENKNFVFGIPLQSWGSLTWLATLLDKWYLRVGCD